MALLTLLPLTVAAGVWALLKAGLLALYLGRSEKFVSRGANVFAILALSGWIHAEFRIGQFNILVFALMMFALVDEVAWRSAVARAASLVVAFQKVVPLIAGPYLLVRRQWRVLAWTAGLGLAALAVYQMIAPMGVLESLRELGERSREYKMQGGELAFFQNQSLQGWGARFGLAKIAVYVLAGVIGLATFVLIAIRPKRASYESVALLLIAMLLLSPDSRPVHLIALILPMQLLWRDAFTEKSRIAQALVGFTIVAILAVSKDLVGVATYEAVLRGSLLTYWMLALWLYFAQDLARAQPAS